MINVLIYRIRKRLDLVHGGNLDTTYLARERYEKLFELQNHQDFIREAEIEINLLQQEIKIRKKKRDELVRYFREKVLK